VREIDSVLQIYVRDPTDWGTGVYAVASLYAGPITVAQPATVATGLESTVWTFGEPSGKQTPTHILSPLYHHVFFFAKNRFQVQANLAQFTK